MYVTNKAHPSLICCCISEAWHTTSWLDHCISTAETRDIIKSMTILYGESISDHVPFLMIIDFESLPKINYEC